ncbi:hypothetical protein PPL_08715 [Heterostelium album PN500]|uniref:Uncharacterized protein n=1 Tax=Heterostelium pallidum (strain ATCC 26659 / Pp 5 / PN500) TaxID=670386 RepID=D3BJI8_HETP5|nr:hypothetical protein PPL_08715 [Heterostelium album PN500]EFA78068.1 hypothetical protein PPL_08715 [Heterostelium album PN500]|eukprot:XP_020430195.1 hypothetical protein PPL_08715 [Heterostelium album PN500]
MIYSIIIKEFIDLEISQLISERVESSKYDYHGVKYHRVQNSIINSEWYDIYYHQLGIVPQLNSLLNLKLVSKQWNSSINKLVNHFRLNKDNYKINSYSHVEPDSIVSLRIDGDNCSATNCNENDILEHWKDKLSLDFCLQIPHEAESNVQAFVDSLMANNQLDSFYFRNYFGSTSECNESLLFDFKKYNKSFKKSEKHALDFEEEINADLYPNHFGQTRPLYYKKPETNKNDDGDEEEDEEEEEEDEDLRFREDDEESQTIFIFENEKKTLEFCELDTWKDEQSQGSFSINLFKNKNTPI